MPLPESIRRAWTDTDYRVRVSYGGFASIRCGKPLPMPLLAMLRHAGVALPLATNRIRQRRLRDELRGDRQRFVGGIGVGPADWREPSLFVPGMTYAQLDAMARRFGQLGVVRGTGAGPAELHELM
jgi:hypothetical protein